jgi:WD40 repeat protein
MPPIGGVVPDNGVPLPDRFRNLLPFVEKPPELLAPPREVKAGPWTLRERSVFHAHEDSIYTLALSPDGSLLATAAAHQEGFLVGEIKFWDLKTQKELGNRDGLGPLAFTPDGKQLFFVTGAIPFQMTLKRCDPRTGDTLPGRVRCGLRTLGQGTYAIAPNGASVVVPEDRLLRRCDPATLKELDAWRRFDSPVDALAFTPDSSSFAAALESHFSVVLCDAATGEPRVTCRGHTATVTSIAFAPDGKRFATGSQDRTVALWDTATGKNLAMLESHSGPVSQVLFSPDGKLLVSSSTDGTVRLWDPSTEKELATLPLADGKTIVSHFVFAPDGKTLLIGREGSVRLWDVQPPVGRPVR